MFRGIKLWFTDRNYYYQRKRYMARQKAVRKELKKQVKEFCPWSGYYMHKMICTMLEFYHKTYEAKDCCWSESAWAGKVAESLKEAVVVANDLDSIDDLENDDLIGIAKKDEAFEEYIAAWEQKVDAKISESNHEELLLASLAEEFLVEKYTKALYNIIGEHIWEWCD